MNKITTIKGVFPAKRKDGSLISGNNPKSGEPWQLWNVTDQDDVRYSGFNLPVEVKAGVQVFIEYEAEQNGKYTNNKIVNIAAVKNDNPPKGNGSPEEITGDEYMRGYKDGINWAIRRLQEPAGELEVG